MTHLSGTDVRSSLVSSNVLLSSLESEAISWSTFLVLTQSDESTRHTTFESIGTGEESGMRSSVSEGNAESSSVSERDVGAPFSRSLEHSEREEIGST